jgi:uncharacterized membrane protein YccF (DUF307 family)
MNQTHLFGIRLWKPALYKKTRGKSCFYQICLLTTVYSGIDRETDEALHSQPFMSLGLFLYPGNLLWVVFFGWWMALIYVIVGSIMILLYAPRMYANLMFNMAGYILWPFGKYVEKVKSRSYDGALNTPDPSPVSKETMATPTEEASPLIPDSESQQRRFSGIFNSQGRGVFDRISVLMANLREDKLTISDYTYYTILFLTIGTAFSRNSNIF